MRETVPTFGMDREARLEALAQGFTERASVSKADRIALGLIVEWCEGSAGYIISRKGVAKQLGVAPSTLSDHRTKASEYLARSGWDTSDFITPAREFLWALGRPAHVDFVDSPVWLATLYSSLRPDPKTGVLSGRLLISRLRNMTKHLVDLYLLANELSTIKRSGNARVEDELRNLLGDTLGRPGLANGAKTDAGGQTGAQSRQQNKRKFEKDVKPDVKPLSRTKSWVPDDDEDDKGADEDADVSDDEDMDEDEEESEDEDSEVDDDDDDDGDVSMDDADRRRPVLQSDLDLASHAIDEIAKQSRVAMTAMDRIADVVRYTMAGAGGAAEPPAKKARRAAPSGGPRGEIELAKVRVASILKAVQVRKVDVGRQLQNSSVPKTSLHDAEARIAEIKGYAKNLNQKSISKDKARVLQQKSHSAATSAKRFLTKVERKIADVRRASSNNGRRNPRRRPPSSPGHAPRLPRQVME